jgi:hypothetical protein
MRWWEHKKDEIAPAVQTAFEQIDKAQDQRREEYASYLSMYEARAIPTLDSLDWAEAGGSIEQEELKENLIRSVINAATAKISTNRPRPRFLTSQRWELKDKAVRRGLFIEGVYHDQRVYQTAQQLFRDGGIFGTGLLKCYGDVKRAKIVIERVLVNDIGVDYIDGKYGAPRSMFQHQTMTRSVAQARWGEKHLADANHIRKAAASGSTVEDPVSIFEAWHLPSLPGATDGRHVICSTSGSLEDHDWTRERYPFVVWRWIPRSLGWHAIGMAEDILSHQHNLDETNLTLSRLFNLMTNRVFVKKGTSVNVQDLDNSPFPVCEYEGTEPTFRQDPGPPPELLAERDRLAQGAFHQTGVSQLSATSQRPKGITAGVALQELKDTESERFLDVGQNWDQLLGVDLPEIILDAADDLAVAVPDLAVHTPTGGESFETVRWSEFAANKREDFQIVSWPAALLPRTPGGRLERVSFLMSLFPQASPMFAGLIQHPDVDAAMKLLSAPVDAVVSDIKELEKGQYVSPEPFLDFNLAKMLVLANYQSLKSQKAPERVLDAHRQYLLSLQSLIEQQQAQQAAMAASMGGMPGPPGAGGPVPAGVPGVGP